MFSGLAVAQENPARRWTALVSFTLQAMLVAAALTYPLLHPDSLPRVLHPVFVPVSGAAVTPSHASSTAHGTNAAPVLPITVSSRAIRWGHTSERAESGSPQAPNIPGLGSADQPSVIDSILSSHVQPPPRVSVQRENIRRSVIMEGNLIHKVEPQYPFIAKQLHIEGTVVLKAFISREGTIERLQIEKGQQFLARAAIEAVQQWRYRPYYLNNQPIAVETEITVNFKLQ
jgi:protein TonB